MSMWKLALRYAPLALKWYGKHKGDFKLPKNGFGLVQPSDEAANWESLANHLQTRVQKRTSELSRLNTKIGLLVVAIALALQPLITTRFDRSIVAYIAAISLGASLLLALWALYLNKAPSAPEPEEIVSRLTERPDMSKLEFQKWLAKRYAAANAQFDAVYTKTDEKIRLSIILLFISFAAILAAKLTS